MRSPFRAVAAVAVSALLTTTPLDAQVGENLGLINPNLASEDELTDVPGLSSAAVDALLATRPFLRMSELHAVVSGHVADDQLEQVYGAMWVPIDLNDATNEEILLIPGVGDRMLHEFEEYRPYVALRQFQREIGKYVDDDELARLAQYVYVRIDLNTASPEEILSIPGVGNRMLHEFEEYRPYSAMAQFRREMGKYVDDDEVERLARYVEIR
jgi:DNA uptake protein ComE-like DNA-binding protein